MDKNNIERPKKFNQSKYNTAYQREHYRKLSTVISPDDFDIIDSYCKSNEISKAKFIVEACKYYIENH